AGHRDGWGYRSRLRCRIRLLRVHRSATNSAASPVRASAARIEACGAAGISARIAHSWCPHRGVEIAREGTSTRRNSFLQASRVGKTAGCGRNLPSGRPEAEPGGPARQPPPRADRGVFLVERPLNPTPASGKRNRPTARCDKSTSSEYALGAPYLHYSGTMRSFDDRATTTLSIYRPL